MDQDRSRNASLDESPGEKPRRPKPRDEFEGVLIGERYTLKRRIGEGGFGAVYEATDERFDSPVAVKLLFDRTNESAVTFRKEAKLIRRFKHPNVVEVYDYGVDDGIAFIVMEFLSGTPLNKFFERHGRRLPADTLRKFVTEIGSALENAHAKHLVHRDLKPQNVMLVDQGQPTERFVLLDLGMATKTDAAGDETIGNPMANLGLTPQYAPPEQFRQEETTHLSDVYSFGTILYHLLAGRLPFPAANTLGQIWHAVEHDLPPLFSEVAPDRGIPEEVEAVVRQCLEKKPESRPQSIREFRERFLKALQPRSRLTAEWAGDATPTISAGSEVTDPQSHPTHRATDVISGVGGASGTATMPMTASATLGGTELRRPADRRTGERAPGRRSWLPAASAGALIVVAAAIAVVVARRDDQPRAAPVAIVPPEQPWILALGREQTFDLALRWETPLEKAIQFNVADVPEHVTAQAEASAGESLRIRIRAAPQAIPRDITLRLVATESEGETVAETPEAGSTQGRRLGTASDAVVAEVPLTLRLVWLPRAFFEPGEPRAERTASIATARRTGWNYFERLDRVLPDGGRVPFLLVLDESDRDSLPPPFYIMQHKVSNGLFEQFVMTHPEGVTEKWREPVTSNDLAPDHLLWPRLPLMNVTAIEALKFAKWLGGERGHLPGREQWRTAAGFYEFDLQTGGFRDPRWQDWQDGPYRGRRVAVGSFAAGRRLPLVHDGDLADDRDDAPLDDVAPRYGLRDMAGNGQEFTSGLAPEGRLSLDVLDGIGSLVMLVGKSYTAESPLKYADLVASEDNAMFEAVDLPNSFVGFRVVLEPPQ
ncbi:MAG TPA: bifunctional serine/threonine-protein kinase/formylglycine-generating enzyme family protein [Planctomycetaceae bacterium]|nr:bifunctional serine/threonine-protein kinase/formylglycine-generating enzyme family protein [Planctomycetaceae bacterium]